MTRRRNWAKAIASGRAASSRTEQLAADAHLRAVDAAYLGLRAKQRPSKSELRETAARALAQFTGEIRRLPAGRPK
jgi:hypothetical protein